MKITFNIIALDLLESKSSREEGTQATEKKKKKKEERLVHHAKKEAHRETIIGDKSKCDETISNQCKREAISVHFYQCNLKKVGQSRGALESQLERISDRTFVESLMRKFSKDLL